MKPQLKIIIFDGSLNTTPFINRLIEGLAVMHKVYVVGFDSKVNQPIPGVTYKSVGTSSHTLHLLFKSKMIAVNRLFFKGKLVYFLRTIVAIFKLDKEGLKQQNFNAVINSIQPDIIHVQWPSLLKWVEDVLETSESRVILSQRGYQNNVRPFVDNENRSYLEEMYPKLDGFHSVSKAVSKVGDAIYQDRHKIDHVVYSGFNLDAMPFSEIRPSTEMFQFISIGRPHWIKGYKESLQACKLLKEEGFVFQYIIIGGKGDEELQYLIDDYRLNENVFLKLKIPQKDVYSLIRDSHLLLLPSHEEGLPNVVLEAMALGVPVVATSCGGVPELLDDNCGELVPLRDATAMAKSIVKIARMSKEDIKIQIANARKKIETRHTTQVMVENMEALYLKCLESKA